MKRIVSLLLVLYMLVLFAACGNTKEPAASKANHTGSEPASENASNWPAVDVLSFTDTLSRKEEVQKALNDYLVSIDAGVQAEFIVNTWKTATIT